MVLHSDCMASPSPELKPSPSTQLVTSQPTQDERPPLEKPANKE